MTNVIEARKKACSDHFWGWSYTGEDEEIFNAGWDAAIKYQDNQIKDLAEMCKALSGEIFLLKQRLEIAGVKND